MKLIKWSALYLSAVLVFTNCKKEELAVPSQQDNAHTGDQSSSENLIAGKYIVVYKNDETSIANISAAATYETKIEAVSDHTGKLFSKLGIAQKSVEKTFASGVHASVASLTVAEAEKLRKDPSVAYVEQDRIIKLDLPAEQGMSAAAQSTPWGVTRVGYASGAGKTAWIIDSGIDLTHPDLVVDAARSKSFLGTGTTPVDQNGHGTHVAGIIGAKNDGNGVVGVAYGATVVSLRALDANGSGTISGIIAAVDWASGHAKAGDVVNMSLGGGSSYTLDQAVLRASQKGIYFAIAAGNSAANSAYVSPARVNGSYIYTVSAMDINNRFAVFSNYGTPVDYCAPGVSVTSTYKSKGYATLSGTSMAAPHVAGLLLLKGRNLTTIGTVTGDKDAYPDRIPHL